VKVSTLIEDQQYEGNIHPIEHQGYEGEEQPSFDEDFRKKSLHEEPLHEYMDEDENQVLHESIKEEKLSKVRTCLDDNNNQVFILPSYEDHDPTTYTTFQIFDASFDNLEREEFVEESLNKRNLVVY
jgi:hypothetical protein